MRGKYRFSAMLRLFPGRLLPLGAVAGAAALVVAACGGGEATATPRPLPTPTTAPTRAPAATATATQPSAATATAQPTATVIRPTATGAQPTPTTAPRPTVTPFPTPVSGVPNFPNAKYGGTLLYAMRGDITTLDGTAASTAFLHDIIQPVYDSPVAYNPLKQDEIVPQLAESWTISSDALSYTFKFRKGVKFQNGHVMTMDDVVWSFRQALEPPGGAYHINTSLLASVASVTAVDDQTVVFKLKGPDAAFMPTMAYGRMHIFDRQMLEREGGRERLAKWPPVGTGPFMAKPGGYNKGISYEVIKSPTYWVPGRPFLNGLKFFFVPDPGTQLAAFLSGQFNFAFRADKVQANEVRSKMGSKAVIQKTPTTVAWSVYISKERKPFDNAKVREAIGLAIDKQGTIDIVEGGIGYVGGIIIPQTGFELPETELKKYAGYSGDRPSDLKKAKQLLAEAGFPNGFSANIMIRANPGWPPKAIVVKANLAEIGIKTELKPEQDAVYFENKRVPGGYEILVTGDRYFGTDPNFAINEYWLTNGGMNFANYSDKKLDDLYTTQNGETDPAKRKAMVNDIERMVLATNLRHTLFFAVEQLAFYANIKNYQEHVSHSANVQMRDVWIE